MGYSVSINANKPSDIIAWEELCKVNGNLNQTVLFDELQKFFQQQPVYFEVRDDNGQLTGGVKMYLYESRKLGIITKAISKTLTQLAESVIKRTISESEKKEILKLLQSCLTQYLKEKKIVVYIGAGIYGNEELIIFPDRKATTENYFNASFVDISKTEEEILKGFNRNTKRNLNKAAECGLQIIETTDIKLFNNVLKDVYAQQFPPQHGPNPGYVKKIFEALYPKGKLDIHLVAQNGKYLSASFFGKEGDVAYSWFGGSIKNEVGAGQFLYWELMKKYKLQGYNKFYFGQVAKEDSEENKKFQGISNFKRGFGLTELDSLKKIFILKPFNNKLWEIIKKIKS